MTKQEPESVKRQQQMCCSKETPGDMLQQEDSSKRAAVRRQQQTRHVAYFSGMQRGSRETKKTAEMPKPQSTLALLKPTGLRLLTQAKNGSKDHGGQEGWPPTPSKQQVHQQQQQQQQEVRKQLLCGFSLSPFAAAAAACVLSVVYVFSVYFLQCCFILWKLLLQPHREGHSSSSSSNSSKNRGRSWRLIVLQLLWALLHEDREAPRVVLLRGLSILLLCLVSIGALYLMLPPLQCAEAAAAAASKLRCMLLLLGFPVSAEGAAAAAAAAALQSLRLLLLLYGVSLSVSAGCTLSWPFSEPLAAAISAADDSSSNSSSSSRAILLLLFDAAGCSSSTTCVASALLFALPHVHPMLLRAAAAATATAACPPAVAAAPAAAKDRDGLHAALLPKQQLLLRHRDLPQKQQQQQQQHEKQQRQQQQQCDVSGCRRMCEREAEAAALLQQLLCDHGYPIEAAARGSLLQQLQENLLLLLEQHGLQLMYTFAFGLVAMRIHLKSRLLLSLQQQQQQQLVVFAPNIFAAFGLHSVCNWGGLPLASPLGAPRGAPEGPLHPLYVWRYPLLTLQALGLLTAVLDVFTEEPLTAKGLTVLAKAAEPCSDKGLNLSSE
ncbi:hypothetical protein Emag_001169 [Eimeria magna]